MKNIPKICHFCWTGGSPLSKLQYLSVVSFHKYNPDWKIIIHVTKQRPEELGENTYVPDYVGPDYFVKLTSLPYISFDIVDLKKLGIGTDKYGVLVSDILRVLYLYEQGGVYSDFDMLWLQPMENFINIDCEGDPTEFSTTICIFRHTRLMHHNASNIVSVKKSPVLKRWKELQAKIKPPYTHQVFNSELLNKLWPTEESVRTQHPDALLIDYKTFYPYSIFNLKQLYIEDTLEPITSKVMGVHWFNGHALSQAYVKQNPHRFLTKCSMTSLLIKEGYEHE